MGEERASSKPLTALPACTRLLSGEPNGGGLAGKIREVARLARARQWATTRLRCRRAGGLAGIILFQAPISLETQPAAMTSARNLGATAFRSGTTAAPIPVPSARPSRPSLVGGPGQWVCHGTERGGEAAFLFLICEGRGCLDEIDGIFPRVCSGVTLLSLGGDQWRGASDR